MKYVTGMVGDRAYTLAVDGGSVQGEESMQRAFADLPDQSEEALLAHCRKLFGDTMKVSDMAPQALTYPFLAVGPARATPSTAPGGASSGGVIHEEHVVVPPAQPGSASMAETPENAPAPAAAPSARAAQPAQPSQPPRR